MEGRRKYSYRIKMQAVRKARKDTHTGKKAHFFYRISRKEGNKGNKKRRGKEERRQGCRKNNGGKNHPETRRCPMAAGCSPKMTGFFNSSSFKTAGRTKRNGRNGFLEIHCLTNQPIRKKHQTKKTEASISHTPWRFNPNTKENKKNA